MFSFVSYQAKVNLVPFLSCNGNDPLMRRKGISLGLQCTVSNGDEREIQRSDWARNDRYCRLIVDWRISCYWHLAEHTVVTKTRRSGGIGCGELRKIAVLTSNSAARVGVARELSPIKT